MTAKSLAELLHRAGYKHRLSNAPLDKILEWVFTLNTPFTQWLSERLDTHIPFIHETEGNLISWNGLNILTENEMDFLKTCDAQTLQERVFSLGLKS